MNATDASRLDTADRFLSDKTDLVVPWAASVGIDREIVTVYIAETRNLTADHAESVVARLWPVTPNRSCGLFNPIRSELRGWSKRCRDCGGFEHQHST
jgi:hypothetical protein